ncbi:MAG: CPBP family intramembrane metalloprotease [Deltaproteobacteria bacterium]|nr:CPBP family intramembrane metalloprotease [Deltaproteobacteria bacterium]
MASKGKSRSRREPTNLLTSVVLVMPLLLFYQVGVIFSDTMNGADLITQQVLRLLGSRGYIWFQLGLGATLVALVLYLRRTQQFELRQFIPVLLESGIYALTMGTLIIFLMVDLLHIDPRLAAGGPLRNAGVFDRLVMSVGAGVHEELVFRLVLLGGLAWIGERGLGLKRWLAILVAFVVSSLLFSAAHHVGSLGEPLRLGVFTYRTIAGLFFAALFQFRSFAIAVYTHALYDIYVLIWS